MIVLYLSAMWVKDPIYSKVTSSKKKKKDPIYSLKKAIVQINIINKAPENKKVAQVNETIIYQEITLSFLIIF